jgi:phage major head subunit gpT-like protein
MEITGPNLQMLFQGFNARFNKGWTRAVPFYEKVAMVTNSVTSEENYGWLGQFPQLREWIGDRVLNNLTTSSFTIVNRDFENTIEVPRNRILDDQYSIFGPMFDEMGRDAAELPNKLVAELMNFGFTSLCYDGQYFFDTDHPVLNAAGVEQTVSNVTLPGMGEEEGPPWFLIDGSRALGAFIYQKRQDFRLVKKDDPEASDLVFMKKKFIYGVDGRSNAGYGLWQLAHASRTVLNASNYAAARKSMQTRRGDYGRPLGIKPTLLLVPSELEEEGLRTINNLLGVNGESNPWQGSVELVVTPWLSA